MIAFTDSNGGYYQADLPEWLVPLWAIGMTPCEVIPPPIVYPKDAIRAQIKSMEQAQLMPRATREFMLLFMETSFTPAQLAQNIGYVGIKAFDAQIKALRDQL